MPKPPKPRSVAAMTHGYADALRRHPLQAEFLDAAIKLCAIDVITNVEGGADQARAPTSAELATVRAEYAAVLQVMLYPPSEERFYCIWSDVPNAAFLAAFIREAWHADAGKYGTHLPLHWTQKPSKSEPKHRKK